jgi:hypothetical protein
MFLQGTQNCFTAIYERDEVAWLQNSVKVKDKGILKPTVKHSSGIRDQFWTENVLPRGN